MLLNSFGCRGRSDNCCRSAFVSLGVPESFADPIETKYKRAPLNLEVRDDDPFKQGRESSEDVVSV